MTFRFHAVLVTGCLASLDVVAVPPVTVEEPVQSPAAEAKEPWSTVGQEKESTLPVLEVPAALPEPVSHKVSFSTEIRPIFEASCIKCHGRGRSKGGFRLDTRETLLRGGDSGAAALPGRSAESLLITLVAGLDPDRLMPKKGSRLTSQQVAILRGWIDQGAEWDPGISLGRLEPNNSRPRQPQVPSSPRQIAPVDRFLENYFASHNVKPGSMISERLFARRVYLDLIGLLPPPSELTEFLSDNRPDKRARLIDQLLSRDRDYAAHWLTFWNDLLRNDYKGAGYIDGGREQITGWLYSALLTNMPYDRFVAQLIDPVPGSAGFTKGIVWRGVVNASQTPQMQAAQNICQVFMGVNLKCASCHDSFVNDLTLADAYGLAGVYADGPLEMVQCDKPMGRTADLKFIYPELGAIDPQVEKSARIKRLAEIVCQRQDGRLTRTIVNRIWQKFFGRGLVEPMDDMEKPAWNPDLLDWLAEDFANHAYDMKHLIREVVSSRAYQLPAIDVAEQRKPDFVFRGPAIRRLSAEQFRDAVTSITGTGYPSRVAEVIPTDSERRTFSPRLSITWIWNDSHAAEKAPPGHVYFRRKAEFLTVPEDARAMVICDNSFTLFVNGKKVGSGSDFKSAFVFDMRSYLKVGENVFAIEGVNHLADGTEAKPDSKLIGQENPAGLMFYARLRHEAKHEQRGDVLYRMRGKEDRDLRKPTKDVDDFGSDDSWICSVEEQDGWQNPGFLTTNWSPASKLGVVGMSPWGVKEDYLITKLALAYPAKTRAALASNDPLMMALGRPNREQVVATRATAATTLQVLEMTNGETLADILRQGAEKLMEASWKNNRLIDAMYQKALSRKPTRKERQEACDFIARPVQRESIEDLLWAIVMLPEFQLIY